MDTLLHGYDQVCAAPGCLYKRYVALNNERRLMAHLFILFVALWSAFLGHWLFSKPVNQAGPIDWWTLSFTSSTHTCRFPPSTFHPVNIIKLEPGWHIDTISSQLANRTFPDSLYPLQVQDPKYRAPTFRVATTPGDIRRNADEEEEPEHKNSVSIEGQHTSYMGRLRLKAPAAKGERKEKNDGRLEITRAALAPGYENALSVSRLIDNGVNVFIADSQTVELNWEGPYPGGAIAKKKQGKWVVQLQRC